MSALGGIALGLVAPGGVAAGVIALAGVAVGLVAADVTPWRRWRGVGSRT